MIIIAIKAFLSVVILRWLNRTDTGLALGITLIAFILILAANGANPIFIVKNIGIAYWSWLTRTTWL